VYGHLSVLDGEGAEVGDDGGTEQHVAGDVDVVQRQVLGVLRPARLLSAEPADQLLGAVELLRADHDVVLQLLLLASHDLELVAESLQLVCHLRTQRHHRVAVVRR